jgi:hypothetical protein
MATDHLASLLEDYGLSEGPISAGDAATLADYIRDNITMEDHLCDMLTLWCERNDIVPASADEMLAASELTHPQRRWLSAYVLLWDASQLDGEN